MKKCGIFLVLFSLCGILFAWNMVVTNLNEMDWQQNILIISGFLFFLGSIFLRFSLRSAKNLQVKNFNENKMIRDMITHSQESIDIDIPFKKMYANPTPPETQIIKSFCSHSHETTINIPITIPIYELRGLLNEVLSSELDKRFPSDSIEEEFCPHLKPFKHGGSCVITLKKSPLDIFVRDDFIYVVAKIDGIARIKGQVKLGLFKTRVSAHTDIEGQIILKISSIKINEKWDIDLVIQSLDVNLLKANVSVPIIGNISVRGFLEKRIYEKKNSLNIPEFLNKLSRKLKLKEKAEKIWQKLHIMQLINESPNVLIGVKPIEILFKNVELDTRQIKIGIGFKVIVDTIIGQYQPNLIDQTLLPDLVSFPNLSNDFFVYMPSHISLKEIANLMKNQKIAISSKLAINVKEFEITPNKDKVIIKLSFDSVKKSIVKINGIIYLTGSFYHDEKTNSIGLTDVDYDLNTKELPLSIANWLLKPILLEEIKNKCKYQLDKEIINKTNQFIDEKVKKFTPKYIKSSVKIQAIKVNNVLIDKNFIHILVLCNGHIDTKFFLI